jgi:hypothetical protein
MSDANLRVPFDDCDDCEGERGKRGKRGHRGHRGHDGHDGDIGPTGPTGPTGAAGILNFLHTEAQAASSQPLLPNASNTVLTCPPITAPVGSIVQLTCTVNYFNVGNQFDFSTVLLTISQDGGPIATATVIAPGRPLNGGFLVITEIPLTWFLTGDGLPHVYSVEVVTDNVSTGAQSVQNCSIFVNAFGP